MFSKVDPMFSQIFINYIKVMLYKQTFMLMGITNIQTILFTSIMSIYSIDSTISVILCMPTYDVQKYNNMVKMIVFTLFLPM